LDLTGNSKRTFDKSNQIKSNVLEEQYVRPQLLYDTKCDAVNTVNNYHKTALEL